MNGTLQSAPTCDVRTHYLFSEVTSRLSSSCVPCHDFYRNFRSAFVICGNSNHSLLTYLDY